MAIIFSATGDAKAQTTNCTSYMLGNIITTDCQGSPRMGFSRSPALEARTFDIQAIQRQNLQNRLLELQIQPLQQQRRQLQQQGRKPSCGGWKC